MGKSLSSFNQTISTLEKQKTDLEAKIQQEKEKMEKEIVPSIEKLLTEQVPEPYRTKLLKALHAKKRGRKAGTKIKRSAKKS